MTSRKTVGWLSFSLLDPLWERNFRLLWIGSSISMVGGQLTLIAFPWLVLQLTGDPLAIGLVMALSGIPRALFMIFGGEFTDRYSPRTVIVATVLLRLIFMVAMTLLVYFRLIEMWMIYLVALFFGVIDAFAWPASTALMPRLLKDEQLPAGNALIQGMGQLSVMMGPVVAGLIIAGAAAGLPAEPGLVAVSDNSAELDGIALVFGLDSFAFVISLITLLLIRLPPETIKGAFDLGDMFRSIAEGFSALWQDEHVRMVTLVFALFSLFWRGPYLVGIPILCEQRFAEGALAYGMIGSAFGVGALLGVILAGTLPQPSQRWYGWLMLLDTGLLGASLFVFAYTPIVEWGMLASAITGIADGYITILLISWLQVRVPKALLGRVMSVIMLFNTGLAPISAAAAGVLIRWSLPGVFTGVGTILVLLSLFGLTLPLLRNFQDKPLKV